MFPDTELQESFKSEHKRFPRKGERGAEAEEVQLSELPDAVILDSI